MPSPESTKKPGVVEYVIPEPDRWGQENAWDSWASLASLSIPVSKKKKKIDVWNLMSDGHMHIRDCAYKQHNTQKPKKMEVTYTFDFEKNRCEDFASCGCYGGSDLVPHLLGCN